jgi:hypothetical protein
MTDGAHQPQEISEMMEELWGPRRDTPAQGEARAATDTGVPSSVANAAQHPAPARTDPPTSSFEPQLQEVRAELAALRADIEGYLLSKADDLAEVRAHSSEEMVQQLRLVLEEAAKHSDEQLAMVRDALQRQLDDVSAEVARAAAAEDVADIRQTVESWSTDRVSRDEFDALRSELRDVVGRQMAAAHSQLQHSVSQLDAAITDARAQLSQRLDEMARLVSTETARAAERALAPGTGGLAGMQAEVWDLKERVREISEAVGAIRQRPPSP